MRLKSYLSSYKSKIIIGPCFKFLETMTDIFTPFLVSKILDVGVVNSDTNYILWMSALVILINVLGCGFAIICQKCSSLTSEGIGRDMRRDLYHHINSLSPAELDRYTKMTLANRVVHDVNQVQTALSMTIRQVARAPFLLIGCTIMALIIDPKLSVIFIVLMPILIVIVTIIMKKTAPLHIVAKTKLDRVSNVTRENLSGVRVVRAFNKQTSEIERFGESNGDYTKTNIRVGNISAVMQPLVFAFVNLAVVAIIWIGGIRVNIGALSQGKVIAFINYFSQISMALIIIARLISVYTRTGASLKRINEVFDTKNSIIEPAKPYNKSMELIDGSVEFKNVTFSYNFMKNVITNLSIKIESGQTIGFIGGTGSGKSSIINLIPRLYDATKGKVIVGGQNVKKYSLKDLRSLIGYVPQSPTLFKGTIRDNMLLRDERATDEDIIKALYISQSYEFVKAMPEFLDAKVERGGTNFSGGQRQRLTIARALVGKPKILILDDSSSALDFATDAALRNAISKHMAGVTTIMVSQRTNSIRYADKIVCLDNGRVAGIGTHDELLATCPVYLEIFYSQNKREENHE